ncbi:MAG: CorA family divalent cation transporter [Solirubrobacteraceae bacterium]
MKKETRFNNFNWIDFSNPIYEELFEFSEKYNLNKVLINDALQDGHFPKFERLENGFFIILRPHICDKTHVYNLKKFTNKIAIFYLHDTIITIHKKEFTFLNEIPENINSRENLLFYIINQIINSYQQTMIEQSNEINEFEKIIFAKNSKLISTQNLYYQKSKARAMKNLLLLSQKAINHIEIDLNNQVYLTDIKESMIGLIVLYDEILEDANSLLNSNSNLSAQKNNEVIRLLTIFSAFFLPLTFIAGLYGMNFENMPELKYQNGYYYSLFLMVIISIAVFIWFKKNKVI